MPPRQSSPELSEYLAASESIIPAESVYHYETPVYPSACSGEFM